MFEINERHQKLLECGEQVHIASVEDMPTWVPVPVMVGDKQVGTVTLDTPARMIKDEFTLDMWYKRHRVTHREREDQWPEAQTFRVYPVLEYHKAAEFKDYTYNGVTVKATRRRPSSRDDKKYERTILVDGKERIVHYGDPDMPMRRDEPDRRENFLARHNCDEKKDPTKPGFWSCYDWSDTDEKGAEMEEKQISEIVEAEDVAQETQDEAPEEEKAVKDLAKHLLDKYGPEHLFTDCMGDETTQDYDEEARKAVCARVHYEALGKWPAEKKEATVKNFNLTFGVDEKGLEKQLELKDEEIARLRAELQKEESLDARLNAIRSAFHVKFGISSVALQDEAWARDVHESYVIAENAGKNYKVPYQETPEGYTFAPMTEWREVEMDWREKAMEECVCPGCGYKEEHERGEPCKECPECGTKMERLMEKATWKVAYVNTLPDSSFLYVEDGDKDEEGKTKPRSKRHFPYKDADGKIDLPHLRNAIARIPQSDVLTEEEKKALQDKARKLLEKENKSEEEEKAGRRLRKPMVQKLKDAWETLKELMSWAEYEDEMPDDDFFSGKEGFAVKRIGDKTYLITHSTNAFQDRDHEYFSTPGLEKYVQWANETGERGTINFWHIPDTDFATKVWQGVEGRVLVEVSEFDDTPLGHYALKFFENYPDGHPHYGAWGCSPEFSYLPNERKTGTFDNFQIVRTSVLPRSKAANIWTKAEVSKMAVSEEQKEALAEFVGGEEEAEKILDGARTQTKELEDQDISYKEINLEALAGELAKQFDVKLEPLQTQGQALEELAGMVKALADRLDTMERTEKAKAENEVPRFTLTLQQKRASQAEETVVPEGDELLEKKPKEPGEPKSGAAAFFGDK